MRIIIKNKIKNLNDKIHTKNAENPITINLELQILFLDFRNSVLSS